MLWFVKSRRAQTVDDDETWIEGRVSPTLNAFDNTGESRATVVVVFQPGAMSRLGGHVWEGIMPTLRAESHGGDNTPHVLIIDGTRVDDVRVYDDEITPCLKQRMGTGGNNVPIIAQETTHDVVGTLQARSYKGPNHENARDGQLIIQNSTHTIAYPIQGTIIGRQDHNGPQGKGYGSETDPMYTLDSISQHGVATDMQVRRLTPVECERLMGWSDNHTLYRADGKTNSDTTRYKMCGNGVASPVAQWIAEQINQVERGV